MFGKLRAALRGETPNQAIPGGIAGRLLQQDVMRSITPELQSEADASWRIGIKMLREPDRSPDGNVAGPWVELWSFTSDASSVEFTITFTPDGVGGTDYNISGEIQKG